MTVRLKESVVLLQVKDLKQIIVKFRAEKILCMFLSCTKHPFEWHDIWCTKMDRVAISTLKRSKLKVYIYLPVLEITKARFRYMIWLMIFEKPIIR